MIVQEHLAKKYLARYAIPVPRGDVARTAAEARAIAERIGGAIVVKMQISSGKRGKSGGVLFASSPEQCEEAASRLLGHELLGFKVEEVLVEEKLPIARELYAGLILDRGHGDIRLIVSIAGGMEVEEASPEAIRTLALPASQVLPPHRAARFLRDAGLPAELIPQLSFLVAALHRVFVDLDLVQIELNPLALMQNGQLVALDCKMEVDDNALSRHEEFAKLHQASLSPRERRAAELGVSFVPLEGDVGVIASGAGLGMATLDLLRRAGLQPADFLDTGGGITCDLMREAVQIVMASESARGLMVNLYGGINPMIAAAEGIAQGLASLPERKPVVVKLLGNSQEEAWRILEGIGVAVVKVPQTEVAVETLAEMLRGSNGHSA